jgi:RNA recognition motif-containing protein
MNNIRETSQQDRRVYVGNLSYDVKWHHLKDFMRQGGFRGDGRLQRASTG